MTYVRFDPQRSWAVGYDSRRTTQEVTSRAEIEQAKGIIMATTSCSADEAFDMLRQQSQQENRKLRDIARELAARQRR